MSSPKSGGDEGEEKPGVSIIEGPAATSREGPDDLRYGELMPGEVRLQPPDDYVEWEDDVIRVNPGELAIEGELTHYHFETDDSKPEPPGPSTVYDVVAVPAVAPMVATLGGLTFHGSPLVPGIGSVDVYAEGKAVFRMLCDVVTCPLATPLPHGGGVVMPLGPPPTVFVNGFAIARAGDAVMELLGGPNPIMMGAPTVLAGPPAPPMVAVSPKGRPGEDERPLWQRGLEWIDRQVEVDVRARADLHVAETAAKANVEGALSTEDKVVGGGGHVEGEGSLMRFEGEIAVDVTLFGYTFEAFDTDFDKALGKWKGHGDVIYDPIQRRPGASGDIDFEVFGGDDE